MTDKTLSGAIDLPGLSWDFMDAQLPVRVDAVGTATRATVTLRAFEPSDASPGNPSGSVWWTAYRLIGDEMRRAVAACMPDAAALGELARAARELAEQLREAKHRSDVRQGRVVLLETNRKQVLLERPAEMGSKLVEIDRELAEARAEAAEGAACVEVLRGPAREADEAVRDAAMKAVFGAPGRDGLTARGIGGVQEAARLRLERIAAEEASLLLALIGRQVSRVAVLQRAVATLYQQYHTGIASAEVARLLAEVTKSIPPAGQVEEPTEPEAVANPGAAPAEVPPVEPTGTQPERDPDEVLAEALARGLSVPAAAAEANLSERTAFRRLQQPEFKERVEAMRAARVPAPTAG